jgi:glc operon protein GlcG
MSAARSEFMSCHASLRLPKLFLAFALVAIATGASSQVLSNPYGAPIDLETAKKVVAASSAEAHKMGLGTVLAVTDPQGDLIYLEKADGSQNGSVAVAIAKSRSAAIHKRSTKVFEDQLASGGVNLRILLLPGAMPVEGGVPLLIDGKIVGAIGSSGGSPPQDGAIAKAGADSLAK